MGAHGVGPRGLGHQDSVRGEGTVVAGHAEGRGCVGDEHKGREGEGRGERGGEVEPGQGHAGRAQAGHGEGEGSGRGAVDESGRGGGWARSNRSG